MTEALETTIEDLKERFEAQRYKEFREQARVIVPPENFLEACRILRDEHRFEMLAGASCVDYWPENEPRFHAVYQFVSLAQKMRLEVRVPLDGSEPVVDSVCELYPSANWYEREMWDMFGIRFAGHPDLRRILMPYDWQGHPLRKDYPLGYEEVEFSFNYEEIEMRKPRPKD